MPNPTGHRVAVEKKTSPLVATAILIAASTDFFNRLSQRETFWCGASFGRPGV
jgi:hypothetical protein